MPKQPRKTKNEQCHHIVIRGNNRQDIFFDPNDRYRFINLLAEGAKRFSYKIHAYCLMTNHVHLVIETQRYNISKVTHNFHFRYTQYFNKKYERTGHLTEGRYNSWVVDNSRYLITLCKYIHLNPVRAGIVAHPDYYQWSSHHNFLNKKPPNWLDIDLTLKELKENCTIPDYITFINTDPNSYKIDFRALEKTWQARKLKVCSDSLEKLTEITCKAFDVTPELLKSPRRGTKLTQAKMILVNIAERFQLANTEQLASHLCCSKSMIYRYTQNFKTCMQTETLHHYKQISSLYL